MAGGINPRSSFFACHFAIPWYGFDRERDKVYTHTKTVHMTHCGLKTEIKSVDIGLGLFAFQWRRNFVLYFEGGAEIVLQTLPATDLVCGEIVEGIASAEQMLYMRETGNLIKRYRKYTILPRGLQDILRKKSPDYAAARRRKANSVSAMFLTSKKSLSEGVHNPFTSKFSRLVIESQSGLDLRPSISR